MLLDRLHSAITHAPRARKAQVLLAVESGVTLSAIALAWLYVGNGFGVEVLPGLAVVAGLATGGVVLVAAALGLHRVKMSALQGWEPATHMGIAAFGALFAGLVAISANTGISGGQVASFATVFGIIYFALSIAARQILATLTSLAVNHVTNQRRVAVYGAGVRGAQALAALNADPTVRVVALVDDEPNSLDLTIAGHRVKASTELKPLISDGALDEVVLAVAPLPEGKRAAMTRRLTQYGACVVSSFDAGRLESQASAIDDVARVAGVSPSLPLTDAMSEPTLEPVFAEKVVMITGAGGTIGQELTQQILSQRPAKLVLFDHSEIALYTAEKDLRARALAADVALVPVLGSVGDERQVRGTLSRHGVEAVLHAASYKHVPLIESNPAAAVVNNVFGTRTLALAARDYGVGHFIYLSSEKASQPDGVMAATKRLAESVVLDIAERAQHTRYSVVRFGNVLNSSGSVIPLFEDQIAKGGPITLTDEEVSRFFISVSEAAHLVLAAASRSVGGELFTLDMGTAVQIQALARSMIESAGLTVRDSETPNGDIEIAEIGLRAGDSLHNAQSIAAGMVTTDHQRILKAQPALLSEIEVAKALRDLGAALDSQNEDAIADVLLRKVAEAEPQNADREAR